MSITDVMVELMDKLQEEIAKERKERVAIEEALDDLVLTREYGTNRYGPLCSPQDRLNRYNAEWGRAYALSKALAAIRKAKP